MITIEKFGLLVIRDAKILLCKPFAFSELITIGGIKEGNEDHLENFRREIREELGESAILDTDSLKYLGRFSDRAAGKSDRIVNIDLYAGNVLGSLKASSEIEELVWHDPTQKRFRPSAIVENKILPYLSQHGYIDWHP